MSRMERDLARLAQGAALVVSRLAELRPLTSSGDSPTAATNSYNRWVNAQNSPFPSPLKPDAPRHPPGRDEVSSSAVNNAILHGLAGTPMSTPQNRDAGPGGNESFAHSQTAVSESMEGTLKAAGQLMLDLSREGMAAQTAQAATTSAERAPQAGSKDNFTATDGKMSLSEVKSPPAEESLAAEASAGHGESTQAGSAASTGQSALYTSQVAAEPVHERTRSDDGGAATQTKEAKGQSAGPGSGGAGFSKRNQSRVPAGQFERVARFAGLGIGMAMGTIGQVVREVGRGSLGGQGGVKGLVLTEANSDRLTQALCRMRGAALKFGQLLSIQDEHVIPKDSPLRQVIDRVREEAEHMPPQQLYPTLVKSLGAQWRSKFKEFEDQPMAAASIGQVHRAVAHDGTPLAVKIQYPGVADSIDSDIATLGTFVGPFAPRGLFLSTALEELRVAMKMETDYGLEARLTAQMGELLADDPELQVPRVHWELSSQRVLATELMPGVPFDQVAGMSQEVRNKVARAMMRLTLRELFEFHMMQTDPNWSNFLYDEEQGKLNLIDFGATMTYTHQECYQYAKLVTAAVDKDREALLDISLQMGFVTGKESEDYVAAHVAAAFITGEPFAAEEYDFGNCNMTARNSEHLSTMLAGRLTPPPRFVYTLHRKLSGAFLSCMRLKAKIACRDLFLEHLAIIERRHQQEIAAQDASASTTDVASEHRGAPLSAAAAT